MLNAAAADRALLTIILSSFLSASAIAALFWLSAAPAWLLGAAWVVTAGLAAGTGLAFLPRRPSAADILAGMLDGILSYTSATRILNGVNQAAADLFGYQREELIGRDVLTLVDQPSQEKLERLQKVEAELLEAGTRPSGSGIRLTGVRKNGETFPMEVTISSGRGSARGNRVAVVRDVSDRRRIELELKQSRSFLNTVIENMPSPVVVYDPAASGVRYVSVNRAYEEMFGVSRHHVIGKTNYDLIPAEQAAMNDRMVMDVLEGRPNDILGTVQLFSSARGRRYLRGTMRVVRDVDDRKYVLTILDDLTDLYRATRQTQLEEERANLYLRVADTAVIEVGPDGKVLRINRKLLRTLPGNEQRYLGHSYRELPFMLECRPCEQAFAIIAQALDGGLAVEDVRRFDALIGSRFFRWKAVVNHDRSSGKLVSVVLVGDDVTEINERRLEAERANRAKSEFLANMSHELRTPLNAVLGYSEMLEEVAREEGRTEYATDLAKIAAAGRQLLTLINNVLDLSKIEAERLELDIHAFDLAHLIDDVRDLAAAAAEQNGSALIVYGEALELLCSDGAKVKQILMNLLENACKFTRDGRVMIRYHVDAERARVEVSDTGIGMSTGQLARVFEAFVQGDGSAARAFGGTGLGLALCERLTELLGGQIEVVSEEGTGTTFTLTLPQLRAASLPERGIAVPG